MQLLHRYTPTIHYTFNYRMSDMASTTLNFILRVLQTAEFRLEIGRERISLLEFGNIQISDTNSGIVWKPSRNEIAYANEVFFVPGRIKHA